MAVLHSEHRWRAISSLDSASSSASSRMASSPGVRLMVFLQRSLGGSA